jgi:hypothetical protein
VSRCAAHEQGDDSILYGCPDEGIVIVPARGTLAHAGASFGIALCREHAELVESGGAVTLTLTLSAELS